MSLLEPDTTRCEQVNKLLQLEQELNIGEDVKYKVEAIKDSTIYNTKAVA